MSISPDAAPRLPLSAAPEGIFVSIRLTPRARHDSIDGIEHYPQGPALKVRVTAPPADGAANAALFRLLAKAWRLPASSFALVSGATSRTKRLLIRGNAAALLAHVTARLEDR